MKAKDIKVGEVYAHSAGQRRLYFSETDPRKNTPVLVVEIRPVPGRQATIDVRHAVASRMYSEDTSVPKEWQTYKQPVLAKELVYPWSEQEERVRVRKEEEERRHRQTEVQQRQIDAAGDRQKRLIERLEMISINARQGGAYGSSVWEVSIRVEDVEKLLGGHR